MQVTLQDGAKANFFDIHHNQNVYIDKLVGTPMPGMGADEAGEENHGFTLDPNLPAWLYQAPEKVFNNFSNGAVSTAIYEAGLECKEPWMFACLMAVCDDHGCLVDRNDKAGFARAMFAMKLVKADEGEKVEDAISKLANSMNRTINALDLGYLDIPDTTELKSKKQKCINLGQHFENHSVAYRRKRK